MANPISGGPLAFEQQVLNLVKSLLSEYSIGLKQHGLVSEQLSFTRSELQDEKYESEIEISFWDENTLVDVLEFFVCEHGKPTASLEEIENWMREQLREMIFKRQRERQRDIGKL